MSTSIRRTSKRALSVFLVALLAIMAAPFGSANAQEADATIADVAINDGRFTTLVAALTAATNAPDGVDFLELISSPATDLTVFAPTDDAFAALGDATINALLDEPGGQLTNILSYHVLGSSQDAAQLLAAGTATTLLGDDITIETRADGNVYINDAQVTTANITAANGIIHVIDAVLLPPAPVPPEEPPTITDIAVNDGRFTTLVTALTAASGAPDGVDFLELISSPATDLTVFAPTDDAFAALGDATINALLDEPGGQLTNILSYHVLGSSQDAAQLLAAGTATTLLGDDITIETRADGNVYINDAQVTTANITAVNGVIHVIDAVLLPPVPVPPPAPPTIADIAVNDGRFTTLVAALTAASSAPDGVDFLGLISDPATDLTVFAPTDDAFAALGDATINALLAEPGGALTDILSYHVLGSGQVAEDLLYDGIVTTLLGENITIETRADGNVYINDAQVTTADIIAANGVIHVIDAVLLPPTPEDPSLVFDGSQVNIVSAVSGRYLDGDRGWWRTNVDTSTSPRLDDEWILEQLDNGNWQLLNAARHAYLDADSESRHYNVDLNHAGATGTEWEIIPLDNGNYLLRTVDYNRYLDYDRHNVDTSSVARADDEWQIVIAAGH